MNRVGRQRSIRRWIYNPAPVTDASANRRGWAAFIGFVIVLLAPVVFGWNLENSVWGAVWVGVMFAFLIPGASWIWQARFGKDPRRAK